MLKDGSHKSLNFSPKDNTDTHTQTHNQYNMTQLQVLGS